jgi:hypothetical protein
MDSYKSDRRPIPARLSLTGGAISIGALPTIDIATVTFFPDLADFLPSAVKGGGSRAISNPDSTLPRE